MASAWVRRLGKGILGLGGIVVLVGLVVGARHVWPEGESKAPEEAVAAGTATESSGLAVAVTPVRAMTFSRQVVVSGSLQAETTALVSARVPGTLDTVYVDEGDAVKEGQTRLFQTDSLKLTKAEAVARHGLVVAESSLLEKQARLEQAQADKEQVEKDVERYRELSAQQAIPVQQFEQYESRLRQAVAAVKDVEALIALSKAQVEQARLNLAIAEKDLADSLVLAPISGRVSQRWMEPGEMAAAGASVVKIENLTLLEVSVYLPEQYYAEVVPGQTQMRIQVGTTDLGLRPVSYKSPTVDRKWRTFEVWALIESPPEGVVPGRLAEVAVVLASRPGLGVPAGAVCQRDGQSVVFVVRDGRARPVAVCTGLETEGWIEVTGDGLGAGAAVITLGQDRVEPDGLVTVVREARP